MSKYNIHQMLSSLPCHFTWEQLHLQNAGRTVEMNIEDLEEHIEQTIQGTEVESYNLMGFYKTQNKSFIEAREYFNRALQNAKTEDEKIVCLGCLAWLTWKEEPPDSSFQEQILKTFNQVKRILRLRNAENIPEVMTEKAFSIIKGPLTKDGYKEAQRCIDIALNIKKTGCIILKWIKVRVIEKLHFLQKKEYTATSTRYSAQPVQEINSLWEEVIRGLEKLGPEFSVLHAKALIKYAIFLNKINRDYGKSGVEFVERAEAIAGSNHVIMRNAAQFYAVSFKLTKAEEKYKKLVDIKPDGFKELTLYGQVIVKKYKRSRSRRMDEDCFVQAEDTLRRAWEMDKHYLIPAFDLVHLYTMRYEDTKEEHDLIRADELVKEIFSYNDTAQDSYKPMICKTRAKFLKKYAKELDLLKKSQECVAQEESCQTEVEELVYESFSGISISNS